VALARALVFDPQLVLMDEPLGALDKQLREHMQIELKELHRKLGVAFVYFTHDQGEALTMSDRVAVFSDGQCELVLPSGETLSGVNGNAQKKAYFEPFEAASKAQVVGVEYNGEQAKIKAMVEAKNITWDVVEVESPDVARGCDEGLFEKIDWAKVGDVYKVLATPAGADRAFKKMTELKPNIQWWENGRRAGA